jgi:hypothetical protein
MKLNRGVAIAALAAALGLAACGGGSSSTTVDPNAAEVSPPGDIPDNQVFVPYSPPGAGYSVDVPEGWAKSTRGGETTFTDKLNSISISDASASGPLTVNEARQTVVPQLAKTVSGFSAGNVSAVTRKSGDGILVTYLAQGKPDPVTDKSVKDAVERYTFFNQGEQVTLTLAGPDGADNVDPWRIVTDSLRWH